MKLVTGYIPGALGDVAALHGRHYAASHGFGVSFETRVAGALGAFLEAMDERSLFAAVVDPAGMVLGSIAIDGAQSPLAQLRWFILADTLRGQGWGRRLMEAAMVHAARFDGVYLYTMEGLDAAIHLYRRAGFAETARVPDPQWGTGLANIRMEVRRARPPT
ncbi:MAG: GNAT family N-acetyltransferase [Rubritepida sp.]|nr:GNAT family N-acetyltransferase [Rubritepida sp.]